MKKFLASLFFAVSLPSILISNSGSFVPLEMPLPIEIIRFSNAPPPPTGIVIKKTIDDLRKFLQGAENISDITTWQALEYEQSDSYSKFDYHCDGVFVDKAGKFYFWILRSPGILKVVDSDGRSALLQNKSSGGGP